MAAEQVEGQNQTGFLLPVRIKNGLPGAGTMWTIIIKCITWPVEGNFPSDLE